MEGIRHAQLLLMNSVPKVVHAALHHQVRRHTPHHERGDLHNAARCPKGVVDGRQLGTIQRIRELGNEQRCRISRECQPKADEESIKRK